ncbi:hypothetical protein DM860_012784 [Cuscuta australis]|uniref:Uncharacterized protein n=1 Tax=Cuscuta australis TaxID=267555 RepID=A0A328DYS1_9ASTE|nr:hypothetical protein DM860_012784 [Cuscuta australis]
MLCLRHFMDSFVLLVYAITRSQARLHRRDGNLPRCRSPIFFAVLQVSNIQLASSPHPQSNSPQSEVNQSQSQSYSPTRQFATIPGGQLVATILNQTPQSLVSSSVAEVLLALCNLPDFTSSPTTPVRYHPHLSISSAD